MKQKLIVIGFITAFLVSLVPVSVFATSATVYVSPASSSITIGGNVTVSVRVNSGADVMNSAQARLNFDSSKLEYVSYSTGIFTTTMDGAASGSSFLYSGAILGGTTSSDKLMFSVTFKTISAGVASLSLSDVMVAKDISFTSVNTGGGSITISAPVVDTPPAPVVASPPAAKKSSTTTPAAPAVEVDKDAPKLVAEPTVVLDKNTITLSFSTDENAKIQVTYTIGEDIKTLTNDELKIDHKVTIGSDVPLIAGTMYKVEITAEDALGNKLAIFSKDLRTTGIEYKVKITDLEGRPLANHSVQLFSDPIQATTDKDGIATFGDVTPGDHTLVFEVDGLVLRKPVKVSQDVVQTNADGTAQVASNEIKTVRLPVRFADVTTSQSQYSMTYLVVAVIAGVIGVIIGAIFRFSRVKSVLGWIGLKFNKIFKRNQ